ncbi:hypothetical protein [Streptomyces sp. NBC_01190]|uniref:golvesin C-terminal-like domain-containing protein n=1 Tax=Streptomyces sp. NBC_01190 TaxID=2903767 RepID=UPI00386DDCBB|nr:hypothetical protein OG519_19745 [Streptomyces sp. NBC_01190]
MTDPDTRLGKGWRTAGDRAVTSAADSDGLHLLVADSKNAYAWKTAAVLAEPGMPADTWIGNKCAVDASHAAVVYAPRTFTNQQDLMLGGAFTAIVDLDTGSVTKLPFTASLAYFDPTCNPATHTAAFTAYRDDKTHLVTVDTSGRTVADTTAVGQVTSAVPVADGTVAALGHRLVHIDRSGTAKSLTTTDSVPYEIRPAGKDTAGRDTFAFLDHRDDTTAHAKVWAPASGNSTGTGTGTGTGKVTTVATAPLTDMSLQQAGTGDVFLAGHPKRTPKTRGTAITPLNAPADSDISSRGRLAVDPVVSPGVRAGIDSIAGAATSAPATTEPAPVNQAAAGSQALTVTATATASGASTTQTVAPPDTAAGATLSPALAGTPSSKPRTATALTADHDPVDTDRWCSVPRNDTAEQALQPTPNQVEWAVDMAVRGDLTSGWITQGGWRAQTGLGTINPQGLFPKPTLTGGGSIPAQVELGILAQESNLWQAESGAIPGQMGNPLAATAGFYGHTGTAPADYWKIDWTHSDCGYGVGQITDGMRLAGHEKPGETSLSPTIQKAVALDYTVNVAASLKILADKWTEVHTTGQTVTVNNDDASKPENWFTAVWNYNLGFNKPAGAPGVSWGLGWYNNPANPIYPASRLAFMDTSLDPGANHDAAHPQDWPYEEKVMGWAAWSIDTGHSYATTGRQDWPGESGFSSAGFQPSWWLTTQMRSDIKPPLNTFCNTLNACDVNNPPPCETDHIDGCDQLHWWNAENTSWKVNCADSCGHESIKYLTLRAEPGRGTRLQYGTPDCTPAPWASAVVVDSVPDGTQTWSDCGTSTSQGTFQFTFNPDSNGQYEAKGDLHQIGGGYQGHFWYAHDRNATALGGDTGPMTILGDWKLGSSVPKGQAMVYAHIPDTGAQTTEATYQIVTPFGSVNKTISQGANESDKWVSLGAYRFNNQPPEVKLSNSNSVGTGDNDIAWDAVAFVPGDYSGMPEVDFPAENPDAPAPDIMAAQTPAAASPPTNVGALVSAAASATATRNSRTVAPRP